MPLFFTAESRRGVLLCSGVRAVLCAEAENFSVSVAKTLFLWYNERKGARAVRRAPNEKFVVCRARLRALGQRAEKGEQ